MGRIPDPTALTADEWQRLAPLLAGAGKPGRPRQHSWRAILNATFYVLRTGGQWRCLPHDMPTRKTAYHYFRRWRQTQVWARMHAQLREHSGGGVTVQALQRHLRPANVAAVGAPQ